MRPAFSWAGWLVADLLGLELVQGLLTLLLALGLLLGADAISLQAECPGSRRKGLQRQRSPGPCACGYYAITSPPFTADVAEAESPCRR